MREREMFLNKQMFVVSKNGGVSESFGDPVGLAELGLLTIVKVLGEENVYELYIPDDVSEKQLETFEKNSVEEDKINWKYRVFMKEDGIYMEYNHINGYVPNAVISGLMYGKILNREEKSRMVRR